MKPTPAKQPQQGAITLLMALTLVMLASLASFYSARSVLMDQLAGYNHAHTAQARWAAEAALASAQALLLKQSSHLEVLWRTPSTCPAGITGPQWACSRWDLEPHPALPQVPLSTTVVRNLVLSPHVLTLHASAHLNRQNSRGFVRESVFVPSVAPAPSQAAPAALVLNGCISQAPDAQLRVCPQGGPNNPCKDAPKTPAVLTHFVLDSNHDGQITLSESTACLALNASSLPGGGEQIGPAIALARSPCRRTAWRSVLGEISDAQLQAWSSAQANNGLTAQTNPPRSIYWIDSPQDWRESVGTADTPALLVFSAKACALRCPRIDPGVRIQGTVVMDSGCDDEKMRGWEAGTIEGQLVIESGLPAWQRGTVLAKPEVSKAYRLSWPAGMDATRVQRINGSWSEGNP